MPQQLLGTRAIALAAAAALAFFVAAERARADTGPPSADSDLYAAVEELVPGTGIVTAPGASAAAEPATASPAASLPAAEPERPGPATDPEPVPTADAVPPPPESLSDPAASQGSPEPIAAVATVAPAAPNGSDDSDAAAAPVETVPADVAPVLPSVTATVPAPDPGGSPSITLIVPQAAPAATPVADDAAPPPAAAPIVLPELFDPLDTFSEPAPPPRAARLVRAPPPWPAPVRAPATPFFQQETPTGVVPPPSRATLALVEPSRAAAGQGDSFPLLPPNPLPDAPSRPFGLSAAFSGSAGASSLAMFAIVVALLLLVPPWFARTLPIRSAAWRGRSLPAPLPRPG